MSGRTQRGGPFTDPSTLPVSFGGNRVFRKDSDRRQKQDIININLTTEEGELTPTESKFKGGNKTSGKEFSPADRLESEADAVDAQVLQKTVYRAQRISAPQLIEADNASAASSETKASKVSTARYELPVEKQRHELETDVNDSKPEYLINGHDLDPNSDPQSYSAQHSLRSTQASQPRQLTLESASYGPIPLPPTKPTFSSTLDKMHAQESVKFEPRTESTDSSHIISAAHSEEPLQAPLARPPSSFRTRFSSHDAVERLHQRRRPRGRLRTDSASIISSGDTPSFVQDGDLESSNLTSQLDRNSFLNETEAMLREQIRNLTSLLRKKDAKLTQLRQREQLHSQHLIAVRGFDF